MNNIECEKYLCNIADRLIEEVEELEYEDLTKTQKGMYWAIRAVIFKVNSLIKAFKGVGDYERTLEKEIGKRLR